MSLNRRQYYRKVASRYAMSWKLSLNTQTSYRTMRHYVRMASHFAIAALEIPE